MDPSSVKRRLTCILAADAAGYSKQMGQDEEGTIRVLSAHRAVIDGIITFHQGRIIGTAGDSVLAEFTSVVEAVRCAVEIQEALKTRNDSLPEHRQMHFRIGVNLGDVVVKNDDLLGDGVNVAARLEAMAEPGGICISSSVYDQITGKLDLGFQDIGEQTLKNISRPIHIYRVSGAAPLVRPAPKVPRALSPPSAHNPHLWGIGAIFVLLVGVVLAWNVGWLRFGAPDAARTTTTAAPVVIAPPAPVLEKSAAPSAAVDANAPRAPSETETQRARVAEAIKRKVDTEVARALSDVETGNAARTVDTKAAVLRAQAEADASRIRADAEAAATRTRRDAEAAARAAEIQIAKAREAADAKARVAAASAPATVAATSNPTPQSASRFDGTWNVTTVCQKHPDGASGYTIRYVAQVKDGVLRGAMGTEGTANSLVLQGNIQPDGSAKLDVKGLTGDAKFNPKGTQSGLPYIYQVTAQFEGSHGTGRASLVRGCDLTFVKL